MWWRIQVSRHPFSMRPEMARWQYQGDTLRSTLGFVWCQECASDACWCVVALLKSGWFYRVEAWYVMWRCASCDEGLKCHAIHFRWGLKWLVDNTKGTPWEAHWHSFGVRNAKVMNVDALLHFWKAGGSTGWKRGMWCEGLLHVMKDSSVTPSIFDEAWNGSLTIPRGHPEKHIGIRLVSGMPKWWMLMRCCTFEKRVFLLGGSVVCDVKVCFMWWRTQVSRHPFSMRPEMARWQYQGDTLRSTLEFVWRQECACDERWCGVAVLISMFMRAVLAGGSVVCDVKVCFMRWRTQVSRHPFSMRPEMARWQYQGDTLRSTLAFVWRQECQSDECWCVVGLLKCGWFYRVEAWYVMWRCASCDEGLKCHAIHFRWGLKWLVDNTKGTPWETLWHSFGVRNAKVMNVDALLHFWNAGGSTGWKRGMWCEGVLHVMKDSSVTPSIFDEAWNGSLTIPRGHPEKHIGIRSVSGMPKWCMLMRCCTFEKRMVLPGGSEVIMWCEGVLHVMKDSSVTPSIFDEAWNGSLTIPRGHPEKHIGIRLASGMPKWWMLMRCCTFEKRVVLPGGSEVCGVKVCFMWWRTQVSRHPFSMRSEMALWQYQGDTLRITLHIL